MSDEKSGSMIRGLLRRVQRAKSNHTLADDHELWNSYEELTKSSHEVAEGAQRLTSQLVRERATIDALVEKFRNAKEHSTTMARGVDSLRATLDRLAIISLNAGLEGIRSSDGNGSALVRIADECKLHTEKGLDDLKALAKTLTSHDDELSATAEAADRARLDLQQIVADAAKIGTAIGRSEQVLDELRERLRKSTGMDSDTLHALAEATEHARALVSALGTLSGRVPEGLLQATLRPVVEPLLKLLANNSDDEEGA
jgi:methyl-accepting chemotaxis protein